MTNSIKELADLPVVLLGVTETNVHLQTESGKGVKTLTAADLVSGNISLGDVTLNVTGLATIAEQEKQTNNLTQLVNQTQGLATLTVQNNQTSLLQTIANNTGSVNLTALSKEETQLAIKAQLPASLGAKPSADSLSIAMATDATVVESRKVPVSYSGTITTGGTAQQQVPAIATGYLIFFQNLSNNDLWLRFDGTASESQPSIRIRAGEQATTQAGTKETGALSIFGAATGQEFTLRVILL